MGKITVSFKQVDGEVKTLEVDTDMTLMEAGRDNGVEGIYADCGGCCDCGTCHVYIDEAWREKVGGPNDNEDYTMGLVANLEPEKSRLACQIKLSDALDGLKVEVAPD